MDTEALRKSLLGKFQTLSADRLQKIQLGVIDLEKPDAAKAAGEVARELHTLKGEARLLGLAAIGQLVHAAEELLKGEREGKVPTRSAVDLLLRACDCLSDLLDDLEGAQRGTEAATRMCQVLLEASGVPPAASARATSPAPARAPATTPGAASSAERPPDRSIRVDVGMLDSLGLMAGDLLVESARAKLRGDEMSQLVQRFSRVSDRLLKLTARLRLTSADRTQADELDGDLHLLRDDAFRFLRRHGDGNDALHAGLFNLADQVAEARLVPLSSVFEAFPRAIRNLAREQGKEVEVEMESAGAGVDRSMLADLRDALVHLLRNAVDHGLEAPADRKAAGKPPSGKLRLRARADGDMLFIDVEDDGRGIDAERLRQQAVAEKLLTDVQAAALSERQAIELIFRPGFSTRKEVSELSGRGVGMDVVKKKVEALGGSVQVSAGVGRGAVFSLRLPQTLSLMRVLLIRLGDDVYGLSAADVDAVMRVAPEDRSEVLGTLTVRREGHPIGLVALGPLLGLNGGNRLPRPPAVVVRHGDDRAALVVDGLVGEREVAVKPCGGDFLQGAPFIAGSAALEDGRVAVLLHVPDIMNEVRRVSRPGATAAAAGRRLRVLLVDDSPIARATEAALLKTLGHTVEEAQDGEEGWEKARANVYDLVLTDVQMPRLNGFELTRRLKSDPSLARLPVVILSSLASTEDKRRGVDAGADAYLVKGELRVEGLAQTIDRLI